MVNMLASSTRVPTDQMVHNISNDNDTPACKCTLGVFSQSTKSDVCPCLLQLSLQMKSHNCKALTQLQGVLARRSDSSRISIVATSTANNSTNVKRRQAHDKGDSIFSVSLIPFVLLKQFLRDIRRHDLVRIEMHCV